MKPTVIATIVCLIAAVSEALVTGSDPRSRFRKLRLPSYSPDFRIWILIGLFYYVMCFVILRHLLSAADFSGLHRSALVVVIAMLGGNAAWNALFFRLGCTAAKLSRIPSVWDARRCANGSNDSDLRIRSVHC